MARTACRWAKESPWVDTHHRVLNIWRRGAPQRYTAVAAVVVVKVAKRKPVANKEARRAVAHALADIRQSEGDFPHEGKFALFRLFHPMGRDKTPDARSSLQFGQQFREQLHARAPALAHAVDRRGETGNFSRTRLMWHPRQAHLGIRAIFFE